MTARLPLIDDARKCVTRLEAARRQNAACATGSAGTNTRFARITLFAWRPRLAHRTRFALRPRFAWFARFPWFALRSGRAGLAVLAVLPRARDGNTNDGRDDQSTAK
jgi:hypothetical protein